MSSQQIEKILKLYKTIAQNPSLISSKIKKNGSDFIIESKWSQRNLERTTNQKFKIQHFLTNNVNILSSSFPDDITSELASATTKDNSLKAILRSVPAKEKDNSSKQFIEIWNKNCLIKNYDLSSLDVHGEIYTDSEFGSFEWSPDNEKLLYIAEKKLKKSEPFYKQKSPEKNDKNDEITKGNEFIYKPDWGEQLVGKHQQVVVVLDTIIDKITIIPTIDESLSPGQVIWTPNGDGIVGIVWQHEPRYLGLIACTNRKSWIFMTKNDNFIKLSSDNCAVRSPRFSLDGKKLIWLERDLTGPHHQAHRLMSIDWEIDEKNPNILIDIVKNNSIINNNNKFFGIYCTKLPKRCWSNDSKYLFFSNQQRANVRSFVFDLENNILKVIQNDSSSLMILDVFDDKIVMVKTSLLMPPKLLISKFVNADDFEMFDVTETVKIDENDDLMIEMNEFVYENNENVRDFNFIFFGPKNGDDKSVPLIVVPHGGPHGAFANIFSLEPALLTLLGYGIIQVNYRGSTGMGADNVDYLQGKVGDVDVKDCLTAVEESLKKYKFLDPNRVALSGGSHGGFLVAHLSGQFPDMFKAVIARNPVIDIAAMFTISDIPDWCAAVTNQSYDKMSSEETEEMLLKMFKSSPIVHSHKVKAPTLMLIGKNDLRVPSSQGKHWYHRLKSNGVETKMLIYDDNHPLSTGPVEIDEIINSILWLDEHLNIKNDGDE